MRRDIAASEMWHKGPIRANITGRPSLRRSSTQWERRAGFKAVVPNAETSTTLGEASKSAENPGVLWKELRREQAEEETYTARTSSGKLS
ncbi:uncharacterized protein LAESUDRAFT_183903 [Laetiporus sulphureus 93-53]|uniref:Uncharacterized protein n=1 Tax=Laetiporus sulphureus 93-53 TaxID=1314785 RepID=A0A165E3W7_9APHY|nr:uncharacterized protein LAESUDRAFT_183903 [Laetiporus sulphureus 93-53]KZT06199.1 hypothetical protein LAESUDRAFT_183903 [Laetiporus sulphureus 93-53]